MSGPRAAVIGGGIGGLAAATALAVRGWQVSVYERAPALRAVGGALTLWSNGVDALDRLGVGAAVRARGAPLERAELRAWDGALLQSLPVGPHARRRGALHLLVDRGALLEALAAALPVGALRCGRGVATVRATDGRAEIAFDDATTTAADLAVGADGLHSVVRASLLGAEPPRAADQEAWVGRAPPGVVGPPSGASVGVVGRGLRFWYARLADAVHWYAIVSRQSARAAELRDKAGLAELFRAWAAPVGPLIASTPAEAITRAEIRDRPPAARWSGDVATLVGDAAHPMTPDLGQGACQALEDAVALGRALAPSEPVRAGLARYERTRRARADAVAELSRLVARLAMPPSDAACALRDATWRVTPAEAFLAQLDLVTSDGAAT
ncbi:MAG: NAD(P)/FAD-dependent oxidoreductase [Polyangiales bacterium]